VTAVIRPASRARRRIPFVRQMEDVECGAACLAMVLKFYGHHAPLGEVRQRCGTTRDGINAFVLLDVARQYGLDASPLRCHPQRLPDGLAPAILHWDQRHFVVLERRGRRSVRIVDPDGGRRTLSTTEFAHHFSAVALTMRPSSSFVRREPGPHPWRRYLRLVLGRRKLFVPIMLASFVLLAVGLAPALLTEYVTDQVIRPRREDLLEVFGIGAASAIGAQALFMLLRARLVERLQVELTRTVSVDFMSHLLRLPCGFFENRSGGDLVARLSNVMLLREVFAGGGAAMLLDALLIVGYLAAMAVKLPGLALVVMVIAAVQIAILAVLLPRVRALTRQELAAQSAVAGYATEVLHAMSLVKATAVEGPTLERWSGLLAKQLDLGLRRGRSGAVLDSLLTNVRMAAPLLLVWLGARGVIAEQLTFGELLSFNMLAAAFLAPAGSLTMRVQHIQLFSGIVERIEDVLRAPAEPAPLDPVPIDRLSGAISVERVSFSYGPHSPRVLQEVSFTVLPGQKVALVGATGCGKTTMSRLLLGLYEPTEGAISYDGIPLRAIEPAALRQRIGVVPQDPYLFNDTIEHNIAFHRPLERVDIEWAATTAVLHPDVARMPMGYSSLVGEGGQRLSGGQRQRVAIARALASRPSILLFDEATSGLDATTEARFHANLKGAGITCLFIAHRLSTVIDADVILVFDDGRLVEQGRHHYLVLAGGRYAELWERQTSHEPSTGEAAPIGA